MSNPFIFETQPFEVHSESQNEFGSELIDPESEEEFGSSRQISMRPNGIHPRPLRLFPPTLRRPSRPYPDNPPRSIIVRPQPHVLLPWSPLTVVHEPSTNAQEQTGSQHVRWVQHSLNTTMGLQLPVDGVMRIEIRRALGSFQKQQGLPITGIVDPQTEDALIAASGNQPPQTGDITTELDFGEELDNFEEEVQVSNTYTVTLIHGSPVRLHNEADIGNLSKKKGLYFIYTRERKISEPWYIGKATKSIRSRFRDRFKVFTDFNFSEKCYGNCLQDANVRVGWYEMSASGSVSAIGLKSRQKKETEWKPIGTQGRKEAALLRVLEMYFINKFKPPGNSSDVRECVEFKDTGKITINYPGMVPAEEVVKETFFCGPKGTAALKREARRK